MGDKNDSNLMREDFGHTFFTKLVSGNRTEYIYQFVINDTNDHPTLIK